MGQAQFTGGIGFVPQGDLGTLLGGGSAAALDDAALLRRVAWGPKGLADPAFAALVGRYGTLVARVCGGVLGDHHAAEDAAQAVFLVLHDRAGALQDPDRLAPWLHGVALRTARHARRRARRELPAHSTDRTTTLPDEASTVTDPADALIARERAEILHAAIRGLPLRYRTPLILCDLQGLTHAEAAAHLGCPLATLSSRLKRAKDQLRTRLARRRLDLAQLPPLAGPVPAAPVGALTGLVRTGGARPSARALADRISWLAFTVPLKAFGAAAVLAGLLALGARGEGPAAPTRPAVPLIQDPPPAAVPAPTPTPDAARTPAPPAAIPQDPPPEEAIRVGLPTRRALPSFHEFPGQVAAALTTELRPPVSGLIIQAHEFAEGDSVGANEVLFIIREPGDSLRAQEHEREAASVREKFDGELDALHDEMERLHRSIQEQQRQKPKTIVDGRPVVDAGLLANELRVQSIRERCDVLRQRLDMRLERLTRQYSDEQRRRSAVTTSFAGVIARRFVDAGATVEAGKTPLAVIAAVDPIRVDFTVDERAYNEVRRWLRKQADPTHLAVRVGLIDEEGFPHAGRVKFQAGQFEREPGGGDAATTLHAEVPNPDRTLVPGQTARVVVEFGDPHPAILVPMRAVQGIGFMRYVWVRDEKGQAMDTPVRAGLVTADAMIEVQGIGPTTPIVFDGSNRIQQNMPLPELDKGKVEGDAPRPR